MLITRETDYALRMLRVLLDEEKHSAAEMAETEPVSYTHLDVYKRQGWRRSQRLSAKRVLLRA